jgi:hypothetical protein
MTVHDDLSAAQRALGEMERAVRALKLHFGGEHDMRRLEDDVQRVHFDLGLLAESTPATSNMPRRNLEVIPEREYDRDLWKDADDEGLGGLH